MVIVYNLYSMPFGVRCLVGNESILHIKEIIWCHDHDLRLNLAVFVFDWC